MFSVLASRFLRVIGFVRGVAPVRAVRINRPLRHLLLSCESTQDGGDFLLGEIPVDDIVDHHDRRYAAGSKAARRFQRKGPVLGRFADTDTELFPDCREDVLLTHDVTRWAFTQANDVSSAWGQAEQGVERGRTHDIRDRNVHEGSELIQIIFMQRVVGSCVLDVVEDLDQILSSASAFFHDFCYRHL
mgnify:CR=1 FL=1